MSMKTLALLPLALPLLLPTGPASNDLEQSLDAMRTEYRAAGIARSNRSYGYVHAG